MDGGGRLSADPCTMLQNLYTVDLTKLDAVVADDTPLVSAKQLRKKDEGSGHCTAEDEELEPGTPRPGLNHIQMMDEE